MTHVIEYRDVSKRFWKGTEPVQAVRNLNLQVREGEFLSIVGPSGCGKSTLLNMVSGLMPVTSGEVLYRDQSVSTVNTKVGYMTQKDSLMPWKSVEDNVALSLDINGVGGPERKRRVADQLERVGLTGFERHYPGELSGGMRKRAILARTLLHDPETLLMDEPFGALDAQLKLIMQDELLKLWSNSGKTIVFVTHDLAEAVALSDRVVVFTPRPGRVKVVQEIPLARPRNVFRIRFTKEFGELFEGLWAGIEQDMRQGVDV